MGVRGLGQNDIPLEHYRVCNDYVFHSDSIKYNVFSIFSVLNGILISALITSDITSIDIGKFAISLFGVWSTFVWFILNARNQAYIEDRIEKASYVEFKHWEKGFKNYSLWGKKNDNKWIESNVKGKYWIQNISAEKLNWTFIGSLLFWWIFYLFYSVAIIREYTDIKPIYASFFVTVVISTLFLITLIYNYCKSK